MNNNIILPMEIINQILIMRPSHPVATILRDYSKNFLDKSDVKMYFIVNMFDIGSKIMIVLV